MGTYKIECQLYHNGNYSNPKIIRVPALSAKKAKEIALEQICLQCKSCWFDYTIEQNAVAIIHTTEVSN
jgi:hypothetical protein